MGAQRKAGARIPDESEELARHPLQAIVLADSFTTKFRPITLDRPKVLLPLVNVPMINYTLAWLESSGVEEVIVFCCSHSKQVIDYLESSEWYSHENFSVTTIESHNSISAGDALRLIYERNVIQGDFVLVSGDTVSNMPLAQVVQEHRDRRKKDSNAVLTMVIKRCKPSPVTYNSRLGTDELFMAIDPETSQLFYYEEKADACKGILSLDNSLLSDNPSLVLHNDKQDCFVDICAPEVLSLFTDNFDYQHLRRHFVKGLLLDDIMGYKIFTHEINGSYAVRVDNYRSYDTVSRDVIQRWTYPFVPDVRFFDNCDTKLGREGMYRASEIEQARSAHIGPFTVIGRGTKIGVNTSILSSVIGKGCKIGSNVSILGSYIWDNVTIEDGCVIRHSIVSDDVLLKAGSVLEPGVVLAFKVIVGEKFVVPAYSKVSLSKQPTEEDSDEELEYAENSSGTLASTITDPAGKNNGNFLPAAIESELGPDGAGYIWSICEGTVEEEWRHSVAPIPADKIAEALRSDEDNEELLNVETAALYLSEDVKPGSVDDSEDDIEDSKDDAHYFEKEVEATFLRAVHENIQVPHVILEMNSLRLSYNMTSADCAGAIFYALMKLALEAPRSSTGELVKNVSVLIDTWTKLVMFYAKELDDQIEVILRFEEMCMESAKIFSSCFSQILSMLYDKDILEEDAILRWADEKADAEPSDKVFVMQCHKFIEWLKNADEEDD